MIHPSPHLSDFYSGKTIFLTGATGSVGLLVVEKLLRSTNVKCIYALVRAADHTAAQSRLESCWDTHLNYCSNKMKASKRVIALPGDISKPLMGLNPQDQLRVRQEVTTVIHLASDIGLLKTVSQLAKANLFGLLELAQFATSFRKLDRFVYVSSFFSQIHASSVGEDLMQWYTTSEELEIVRNGRDPFPVEEVSRLSAPLIPD
jgi:fatty acyl-CoA reductase